MKRLSFAAEYGLVTQSASEA